MNRFKKLSATPMLIIAAIGLTSESRAAEGEGPKRMVLVELYTSQGCDMCPAAEKILGSLAERDRGIVPIAFHVDYFNAPWRDVFSDELYSQRQMTYNQLYSKPKNAEYGIYYTPMLRFSFMIDASWNRRRTSLAVFVQDKRTAVVLQAADAPWRSTTKTASSAASTATSIPEGRSSTLESP